jgi:hypothetical protein
VVAFAEVARAAQGLEVVGVVGAASTDRDDVVNFEFYLTVGGAGSTQATTEAVALQNLEAEAGRNGLTGRLPSP